MGITGMSMENLVATYKKILQRVHPRPYQPDIKLVITMSPSSPSSGELKAFLVSSDGVIQNSILITYQHYYMLNAIRNKLTEIVGEKCSQIKAVFCQGELDFFFEHS